jgi:hypothetical protein
MLPAGWVTFPPQNGLMKSANMFLVFIEGIASDNAEGKPVLHQGKSAVLVMPAKNLQTGTAAAMVVGGFVSDPQAAPGAYGVYSQAKFIVAKTSRFDGAETVVEENWTVATETGDALHFDVGYARGVAMRTHVEPRIYAAAKPEFYRIYKTDQVTEIVHSNADEAKRARKIEISASGPQLSKLFDGKQQLVAIMTVPAYYRQIFLPE